MLVCLSDTHGTDDHRLRGRTLEAVREADLVAHAGDFTTESVLESFRDIAGPFRAVHGNADRRALKDRLSTALTFEYGGVRFAMAHRQRGGDTGLVMLGRERNASVVVHGHTHRPRFDPSGAVALLNPGSHADPRGNRPAHAELEADDGRLEGRLVTPEGTVLKTFELG